MLKQVVLYKFSKTRLIVLFELKKKGGVSSNLTDLNLVEYSTSKDTHQKEKLPQGHSKGVFRGF